MSNTPKNIYLVVTKSHHPAKGQHTENKDWGRTASWEVFETPRVTDSLKTRQITEADIIINLMTSKIEKNRGGLDEKTVFVEYVDRFSNEIARFISAYYPEFVDDFTKTSELNVLDVESVVS